MKLPNKPNFAGEPPTVLRIVGDFGCEYRVSSVRRHKDQGKTNKAVNSETTR